MFAFMQKTNAFRFIGLMSTTLLSLQSANGSGLTDSIKTLNDGGIDVLRVVIEVDEPKSMVRDVYLAAPPGKKFCRVTTDEFTANPKGPQGGCISGRNECSEYWIEKISPREARVKATIPCRKQPGMPAWDAMGALATMGLVAAGVTGFAPASIAGATISVVGKEIAPCGLGSGNSSLAMVAAFQVVDQSHSGKCPKSSTPIVENNPRWRAY